MTFPLLDTKLHAPRRRSGLVARPRLTERLRRGTQSKLTLVSAPAGFGKSTVLAEWLAVAPADGMVTAWLSLDPGDNEPVLFWTQVIAALQAAVPGIGASARSLLESAEPAIEAALTSLLNDLNAVPSDVALLLDDYHAIDAHEILAGMAFFVDHLPDRMHLVIAARADPVLPLARLRARGDLMEIRAVDLRFTPEEAAAYFNGVMDLGLTAGDVEALEGRTEGWIAALQLAGLSMQGRDDLAGFIAGFAGDDRYIVDYLVEEVLQRQSEDIRSFLLRTSILTRLSGALCDAVTRRDDGRATLEALDRGNLFLIALDDRRQWYRYHHLFADVLRTRLLDEQPELLAELHRRATAWYELNGERGEAIRHAMEGGDFARAADLVELALPAMGRTRQESTLRHWLEALPDELIRVRPVLSDGYAGSLLVRGELDGVEERLRDAERWLEATATATDGEGSPSGMVVADEDAFRALPGSIAMHRAGQAQLLGDVASTMTHARRVLDLVAEDNHLGRGGAAALLALAHWSNGDLDAAARFYAEALEALEKAGHLSDVIGCSLSLADIRLAQGRLTEAMSLMQRGLELATSPGGATVLRGAADMHVGIGEILRERDDLTGAAQHLQRAMDLGEANGLPQNPYRTRVAAAGLRQVEGDLEGALQLLGEAARLYTGDFSPDVRPVPALRARALIAQGRLPDAWDWARERRFTSSDDLSYLHEFDHITLARLLLAQGTRDREDRFIGEAEDLLARLLGAAEAGGRNGSVIEILVVQALARQARGDLAGAVASLERLTALAEPEGYVRIVIDEGPPMVALLKLATRERHASGHLRRLLAASAGEGPAAISQPLVEPLSERELDVLRLLESELDGPGMARELTVSLATVRTHTQNIYAKLGVNSRRAAVRRAAELGLLSRDRDRGPSA